MWKFEKFLNSEKTELASWNFIENLNNQIADLEHFKKLTKLPFKIRVKTTKKWTCEKSKMYRNQSETKFENSENNSWKSKNLAQIQV